MGIDFTPDRWEAVRARYRQWWAGTLPRPLLPVTLAGRDPGRPMPAAPVLTQATCADFSYTPEALIDRLDYELSTRVFLGDAFPLVSLDSFGPGVLAAFLGARLDNRTGNVWFHPPQEDVPLRELHFTFDPENRWFRRIADICAAGVARWQGQVLIGQPDLGGNLDVLSTFLPGERLLLALYDEPDEVVRLTWEAHEAWHQAFAAFQHILQPGNPGHSAWCQIFSDAPFYILQCDFSYMIGPQMFDEFVLPELAASARRLPRAFYHLDGTGQLPHLDSVLAVEEIAGVQWVPGEGHAPCAAWPEVYRRIFAAGKKTQLWGPPEELHGLLDAVGLGGGVHGLLSGFATLDDLPAAQHALRSFGCDA